MAEQLGIHRTFISDLERGRKEASIVTLELIAKLRGFLRAMTSF